MMNLRFNIWLIAIFVFCVSVDSVWASREPRPIATDPRIKVIMYSPNEVFKFDGYLGYQSNIEFAEDEEILTISIGNSLSWNLVPNGNRLFIKPLDPDATTNMTLITNKRTYLFEMHSKETESISDKNLTFSLRFVYPGEEEAMSSSNADLSPLPDIINEPEQYNFRYSIRGSDFVAPIRIFDDGRFTYFEFRDKNAEVPAFFSVDAQGNESIINFRARGDYIIVERVSNRFTLRHGGDVVCVYNEAMPNMTPAPDTQASAKSESSTLKSTSGNVVGTK
jgi:type IV secretion system protein VirB9